MWRHRFSGDSASVDVGEPWVGKVGGQKDTIGRAKEVGCEGAVSVVWFARKRKKKKPGIRRKTCDETLWASLEIMLQRLEETFWTEKDSPRGHCDYG